MIKDPDILLADEPTGNLDPVTSFELIKVFEKINFINENKKNKI